MINSNYKKFDAFAKIYGSDEYKGISGYVTFTNVPYGVVVCAYIKGLPPFQKNSKTGEQIGPFGFHIHNGTSCGKGSEPEPFKEAMGHYNPTNQPHGNHAGDFPVLFSNNGISNMCFFTNKFKVSDIIGKTVVIHQSPDDYRTEPAGNSGKRIACGVIKKN